MKHTISGLLLAALVSTSATVYTQLPAPTELLFSEYVEGSSNNKALEIYNGTGAAVDLGAEAYSVQIYFNGATSAALTINLSGTVASGDVFVLAQSSASATILAQADQTNGSGWFNGDDAVVLRHGTTVIDVIGQIGVDPGTEWGTGLTSTADNTLRRSTSICAGDTTGTDGFDPAAQWDGFATDTFDGLGSHQATCATTDAAPVVSATFPATGAADFPLNANLTVTFSEPVSVSAGGFALSCGASGLVSLASSGGPTSFLLDPDVDLVFGETCVLVVAAASVTDQDGNDPPDGMEADVVVGFTTAADICTLGYTRIPAIQGSGPSAAITGAVTTQGVVVGDYEGPAPALRGFFLQDTTGDGDAATSDGIFVFDPTNANRVTVGTVVRVSGNATEFQGQTQIVLAPLSFASCGTGSVAPTDVTLPFASAEGAERYEGMLVRFPQTLYVTEHFQLGRFGQVVLSSGDRLVQPTSVATPGSAAAALQAANDLNRIIVDDGRNDQNPDPILFARNGQPLSATNTLRGGDTASSIVGVMTYTWAGSDASPNAWRVRPVNALGGAVTFNASNPRPDGSPDVGGTLRVAGMNLLNYFNTFDGTSSAPPHACTLGVGGDTTDCRGADDLGEFDRQWPKTVTAILATGAGVIGIVEMENDGYGPDSAIADLVAKLNAATAPGTYAFVNVDSETGQVNALGTDAIKVGVIYQPAAVFPVGQTAVLNTTSFVTGGDSGPRNRPALAQAFQTPTGGRVVAVVNHLKSKGSACDAPDAGDGQGNCNQVRANAATELAAWLNGDPTATDAGVLIVGDLNAYAQEDPIAALGDAGFVNLIEQFSGPRAYSYVFDGQWGYLDHALASPALGPQVTGVSEYHINADEPSVLDYNDDFKSAAQIQSLYAPDEFRVSDHDPVIVGLDPDPDLDGQVTGAGWFASPAGAIPSSPSTAGNAVFALTSRYRRGAIQPSGAFTLLFPAARGLFVARAADWLTVGSSQAILQGQGTINGTAGYSFRLSVVDGGPGGNVDRIALRIWSASGALVYDVGAPRPIGGGFIVLH